MSGDDEASATRFLTAFVLLLGKDVTVPPLRGIDRRAWEEDGGSGSGSGSDGFAFAVRADGIAGATSLLEEVAVFFPLGK